MLYRNFIMISGSGNSLEAIEGVSEIHFNDYCRFWHNNFIGYVSVTFTNFTEIPSWRGFIRLPFKTYRESVTHLYDAPNIQVYAGTGTAVNTMSDPIPVGEHHFDMVVSLI